MCNSYKCALSYIARCKLHVVLTNARAVTFNVHAEVRAVVGVDLMSLKEPAHRRESLLSVPASKAHRLAPASHAPASPHYRHRAPHDRPHASQARLPATRHCVQAGTSVTTPPHHHARTMRQRRAIMTLLTAADGRAGQSMGCRGLEGTGSKAEATYALESSPSISSVCSAHGSARPCTCKRHHATGRVYRADISATRGGLWHTCSAIAVARISPCSPGRFAKSFESAAS